MYVNNIILIVVTAQFFMANIHLAVEHKHLRQQVSPSIAQDITNKYNDKKNSKSTTAFLTTKTQYSLPFAQRYKRLIENKKQNEDLSEVAVQKKHKAVKNMDDEPQTNGTNCTTDCGMMKEAETVCSTCDQVCHYVPSVSPRVKCGCYRGYAIGRDLQHCIDIDECSTSPWLCHEGTCLNTVGSYVCRCRPGYQLIGHVCVDIDECNRNKHICHQLCINVPGSYQCWCHSGFTLSPTNPASCVDIDECNSSVCSHNCTNTIGSFSCSCPRNLTLHADGRTCMLEGEIDINSKDIFIDGNQKIVIYGNNSAGRMYNDLWSGIQLESEDSSQGTNLSTVEGWSLSNTSAAFSSQPEILTVNMNKTRPHGRYRACVPACKNGGICDGRGKCYCRSGFQGRYCQIDVNECSATPSVCSYLCVNMIGSYQCICPDGYNSTADRKSCIPHRHNYSAVIQVVVSPEVPPSHVELLQTYPSQVKPLDINPSGVKPFDTNPSQMKSFDTNPSRIKPFDTNPSTVKPFDTNPTRVKPFDTNPTRVKPFDTNPSGGKQFDKILNHVKPFNKNQSRVKPHDTNLDGVKPFDTNRRRVKQFDKKPSQIKPFDTNPSGVNPFDTNPSGVNPFDTNPSGVNPFDTNPSGVNPFDTNPSGVNPFNTNSRRVKQFDTNPSRVGYHRTKLHNQLAIENLHTMISSSLENELPVVEMQPTVALHRDLTIMPSSSEFIVISQTPVVEFHRAELVERLIAPTSVDQDVVVPTMWTSLTEDTNRILDTLFSFILGTDDLYVETSRRAYFEPTSSVLLEGNKISPTASEGVISDILPTVSVASNVLLMSHIDDLNTTAADKSRVDSKKERKIRGKNTKRLGQKNRKERKLKNKTLRKGRIKLVRLTKDFQVLHQILDASRESWRTDGSSVQQRTETNWDERVSEEDRISNSGTEDRYFEVIDYDEDMQVPASLSMPKNELPMLNQSRKKEADCSYRNQIIKSRSSIYQDNRKCTRCLCKDGELQCKPRHCPIPHCEAPLQGECCDYCPNDCVIDNNVYLSGERFTPAVDPCRECRCKAGRAVCEDVHCRQADCPKQHQVYVPDECCPTCLPSEPGCHYKGRFFYQGQLWVRKEGGCQACLCRDGEVQCNPVVCVVDCQHPQFIPGECCPLCEGCQHYNHKYDNQEVFPHPSDSCSLCHCQQGNITCYPKPCNVSCSHPYKPAGECCAICRHCYFNNRKISNGASLVINSGTCQECTCSQGNVTCQPSECAAGCIIHGKPIPSGAEFHIGSDMCTQCRCWNGSVSCQAVECHNTCSHGVLLPHKCCLNCTKCDFQGELYSEMQVFRLKQDKCKSCLCVKGNVMCQVTCVPKH